MNKILGTIIICLLSFDSVAQTKEFTAMEYVGGIGNRILKVWVTDSLIFAAKVKGLTSVTTYSPLDNTQLVVSPEKRNNPDFYVDEEKSILYSHIDFSSITPKKFLEIDNKNFVIRKIDILESYHKSKKKWGMGGYTHNGRIFVISTPNEFNSKKKRELILIGDQDEKPILEWIKKH
ncbi:hypothetical protein ACFSKL_04420 [Belliella marina]|uniref:Uncharacterized protein n=1 Tax=Belliella marina TaxID=1644146 RepID=A0ABW4VJT3_9BACT